MTRHFQIYRALLSELLADQIAFLRRELIVNA
jgi:hypothetical protein